MNNIAFEKGVGLLLNNTIVTGTNNANWEALAQRLKDKPVKIVVTSELPLNGTMADCGPMFAAFNVDYDCGSAFLQNAALRSRLYSWRLLGPVSKAAGQMVNQGTPMSGVEDQTIAVVVSRATGQLNFAICYAYREEEVCA